MHTTRQIWYAVDITFSVIAVIASAAIIANPSALFLAHSDRAREGSNFQDQRTGTISLQTEPDHCEQAKFDNVTGRITEPEPCDDQIVVGSRRIPAPVGTLHRLEAIRKSFSGRQN